MAKNRKLRRQQHGSAWHWKQTDCWYYTESGSNKHMPLFDGQGERVRGQESKEAARLALARIKVADELSPPKAPVSNTWTVARVCDAYLVDLHRSANPDWALQVEKWLNDLCNYCGVFNVSEFKKKHLRTWLQRHTTWNHNCHTQSFFCCPAD